MKKYVTFLILMSGFFAMAQKLPYFPTAQHWEHVSPSFFNVDTVKINQAMAFAKSHESTLPKHLWLSQALQFGK